MTLYELMPIAFFGLGFIAGMSATMLVLALRKALCRHSDEHGDVEVIGEVFTTLGTHDVIKALIYTCLRCGNRRYGGEVSANGTVIK